MEFTLGGHTASVNVVKWGGADVLYTASSDRTVRVWYTKQGKPLHTLKDHAHWVTTLALNTDFILCTGPYDHTGKKPASDEDGQSPSLLSSKQVHQPHPSNTAQKLAQTRYTTLLRTSPTELLISGSDDHTLFLWSPLSSTKPIARLTGHQRQVFYVSFSLDGRWSASAAWDNSVRV